jgi:hypothetical protein
MRAGRCCFVTAGSGSTSVIPAQAGIQSFALHPQNPLSPPNFTRYAAARQETPAMSTSKKADR